MLSRSDRWWPLTIAIALSGLLSVPLADGDEPRLRELTFDQQDREWVELPTPPAGTAEGDLHRIRVQIKDGKYGPALRSVKRFAKKYGEDDAQYPAALIAKAEAMIGRHDYYKAYGVIQSFLDRFAGMDLTSDAIWLEFVIAETYLTGTKRKLLGVRWLSGEDIALRILDEISVDFPESQWAEYAIKTKADYHFGKGEHGLAELEYARLLRDHPQTRYHQPAMRRSAEAALATFAGVEYDEAALIESEERYRDYSSRYPAGADREDTDRILDGVQQQRGEKDFSISAYYERTEHLSSAVFYYQSVVDNWPDTVAATKARDRLGLLGVSQTAAPTESVTP